MRLSLLGYDRSRWPRRLGSGKLAGGVDVLPSLAPASVCAWPIVAAGARLPLSKPQVMAHWHTILGKTLPLCTTASVCKVGITNRSAVFLVVNEMAQVPCLAASGPRSSSVRALSKSR